MKIKIVPIAEVEAQWAEQYESKRRRKKRVVEAPNSEWCDETLREIVNEQSAGQILAIPGIYEVLSEHFNNEVLERWDKRSK